jgi:hypothetical protein
MKDMHITMGTRIPILTTFLRGTDRLLLCVYTIGRYVLFRIIVIA